MLQRYIKTNKANQEKEKESLFNTPTMSKNAF